jgi:hypothetical protein
MNADGIYHGKDRVKIPKFLIKCPSEATMMTPTMITSHQEDASPVSTDKVAYLAIVLALQTIFVLTNDGMWKLLNSN